MTTIDFYVAGSARTPSQRRDILNPATEEPVFSTPVASETDVDDAIRAAKAAFPLWSGKSYVERGALIAKIADAMDGRRDEFALTLSLEQGKPLPEAHFEVDYTIGFLRYFSQASVSDRHIEDMEGFESTVRYRPYGVVVGISPWNFPLLLSANKLGQALVTGNCFILKPAPTTPVCCLMLGEICNQYLPDGVVSVLPDDHGLGPYLTRHPDVAKVSFTGSTETGRKVGVSALSGLKRLTLELGGNDAGIILDDCDVADIAPQIFGSAFANCGQVCIAMKRVYAPANLYDDLCDALAGIAQATQIGPGTEDTTQLGPIQNRMQFQKAKTFLDSAKQDGTVIAGGRALDRPGYFIEPTIVRDVSDGDRIVDDEQFSPILPIVKYDDVDTAIERANASPYGLGGSVWSKDPQRAANLAHRIESGSVWVNHHLHMHPSLPFGGMKSSGVGVELGEDGIREFVQPQVVRQPKLVSA